MASGGSATLPVRGEESIMSKKEHGTCSKAVMENLLYGCDFETADRICCFNRHYAEHSGYFIQKTNWKSTVSKTEATQYFDSVSGNLLFTAPIGRTFDAFLQESMAHGWPSFRDDEVNWDYVRVLQGTRPLVPALAPSPHMSCHV